MSFVVLVSLEQSCFKICILMSGIFHTEFGNTSKMKCYLVEIGAQVKTEGVKKSHIYASETEKNCLRSLKTNQTKRKRQAKHNREILLGQYLNKTEDPTHSYVSTCILNKRQKDFPGTGQTSVFLEDFTELSH